MPYPVPSSTPAAMNTKHLETFVWVAKLRSFRKAAGYLGTSIASTTSGRTTG